MKFHSECCLLGSWAQILDEDTVNNRFWINPPIIEGCNSALLFDSCFSNSSVLIGTTIYSEVGPLSEYSNIQPPKDYEVWPRIASGSNIANIIEVIIYYRETKSSMTCVKLLKFRKKFIKNKFSKTFIWVSCLHWYAISINNS